MLISKSNYLSQQIDPKFNCSKPGDVLQKAVIGKCVNVLFYDCFFYQILCQDFISFNLIYSCFPGIMLQSNRQLDFCGLYFTRGTDMLRFWTVGMRIWIISMGNVYNEISSNSNYATANFHYRQVIWVFVSFYSHFQLI